MREAIYGELLTWKDFATASSISLFFRDCLTCKTSFEGDTLRLLSATSYSAAIAPCFYYLFSYVEVLNLIFDAYIF